MQKTEFFGRDNELDILKQCWHRARSGNPQIVNIIADSGVGKTRLVQAFYEWLSTNEQNTENSDPKKYWPQTLGSGRQSRTNPSIEEFDQFDFTTSRIPWLWWGMRWNEIRNEYDSVFSEFHQKLILHLDILEIERSFKKGSLSAVTAMLLDEGIDFASHLVPGLSQAVNLVTLSKKIKRNLDERKEKQRSLLEQQKSVIDALESEVIKRLHQLYTPNRNDVTTDVPLVIFLDDIQFAADVRNDEATLNFIDKLIRQAKELEWPILFIATHWKTSWLIHGYDEDQKSKVTWRRMIDDIENKKTFLPDNVNSIELRNLNSTELLSILNNQLPGLEIADYDRVLNRVDNVRWLLEIITTLLDNDDNFVDLNQAAPLSKYGKKRLEVLLQGGNYLEVVRKRLESRDMREVRHLLGGAACCAHSLEFVTPLIHIIGKSLITQGVLEAPDKELDFYVDDLIRKAIDPAAILRTDRLSEPLPTILQFSERSYLEVARELFDPDKLPDIRLALGEEIIQWLTPTGIGAGHARWEELELDSHRVFLEIARHIFVSLEPSLTHDQQERLADFEEALASLVSSGVISKEYVSNRVAEKRSEMLSAHEGASIVDASKWRAIASLELIYLLINMGNKSALALALELKENDSFKSALPYVNKQKLLRVAGTLWKMGHCQQSSTSILHFIINQLHDERSRHNDLKSLTDLVVVYWFLGKLFKEDGLTEQAVHWFSLSSDAKKQIEVECFDNQADMTKSRFRGITCFLDPKKTDYESMIGALEENVCDFINWACSNSILDPKISSFQEEVRYLLKKSQINESKGSSALFQAQSSEVINICRQWIKEHGLNIEPLNAMVLSLERLANLDFRKGKPAGARRRLRRGLSIQRFIIKKYDETPERLQLKARLIERLADYDVKIGKIEGARAGYEDSLSTLQYMINKFGESSEALTALALCNERMAKLEMEVGNLHDAYISFERGHDTYQDIIEKFGVTPKRVERLIKIFEYYGDILDLLGNNYEALKNYGTSLNLIRQLPENDELVSMRINVLYKMALLELRAGDFKSSQNSVKLCIAAVIRMSYGYGDTIDRLEKASLVYECSARVEEAIKNVEKARAYYVEALKMRRSIENDFDTEILGNSESIMRLKAIIRSFDEDK